jgi:hypothetical protein
VFNKTKKTEALTEPNQVKKTEMSQIVQQPNIRELPIKIRYFGVVQFDSSIKFLVFLIGYNL